MKSLSCCECGTLHEAKPTVNDNPRLPRGWKKHDGHVYCAGCWSNRYALRSVVIPVASPVSCDWETFKAALATCWDQSTGLANWAVTELAKADVTRMPGDSCLPSMPPVYLYPRARALFPLLPSKTLNAVLNNVQKRYCKSRLGVIWRSDTSLQRYRYPVPYPVPSQAWKARYGDGNVPLIEMRLGNEPFTLRLRGGYPNRRQLQTFAKIVSGQAVKSELAIYRQRASLGDHRSVIEAREPGGGARVCYSVLAKLTCWVPRTVSHTEREGALEVRTASDSFLIANASGHQPWILNADHVRRWVASYRKRLHRLSEDTKYEKRWPKRARRQMADFRAALVERQRRRVDTFCHQAAAMLAGYAERIRVARMEYDDTDRSFVDEFPWYRFQQLLEAKLAARGIEFLLVRTSGDAASAERKAA